MRDPAYAATQFFTRLLEVPRWDQLPATVAAQAVQRSAFPNAYAKWEPLATALVAGGASREIDFKPTEMRARDCAPLTMHLASGCVEEMLQSALAQEGKPYVFGATGPDAFDCSGLLVYAWRQAGYRMSVRTAAQMHQRSDRVEPGQEQPGDIVFREFNTRVTGPGHMLIVIQPGLAIEAPSSGKSVRIRPYNPHAAGQELGRLDSSVLVPVRTSA